jgi:hypothetical protein
MTLSLKFDETKHYLLHMSLTHDRIWNDRGDRDSFKTLSESENRDLVLSNLKTNTKKFIGHIFEAEGSPGFRYDFVLLFQQIFGQINESRFGLHIPQCYLLHMSHTPSML